MDRIDDLQTRVERIEGMLGLNEALPFSAKMPLGGRERMLMARLLNGEPGEAISGDALAAIGQWPNEASLRPAIRRIRDKLKAGGFEGALKNQRKAGYWIDPDRMADLRREFGLEG